MSDSTTSGNRWEPTTSGPYDGDPSAAPDATTATAVQDRPAETTTVDAAQKPGLRGRTSGTSTRTRWAAGIAAVVLGLGAVGGAGFAIGRATAPDNVVGPGQFVPGGGRGFDPDGDGAPFGGPDGGLPPGAPGSDQGLAPGTDPGTDSESDTDGSTTEDSSATTSWYVVPNATVSERRSA